jgi:hypothetical protein
MTSHSPGAAVAASIVVLTLVGCGGSSKKSTSSTTSASQTTTATSARTTPTTATTTQTTAATTQTTLATTGTTATTTGSRPLSKAAYEAKLSPLLNDRVVPALKSVLANGGSGDPQKLKTAAGLVKEARNAMASLTPPARVADLNREAVATLGALAGDMTRMSDSLQARHKAAYVVSAKAAVHDALKIQSIGGQFTTRGY